MVVSTVNHTHKLTPAMLDDFEGCGFRFARGHLEKQKDRRRFDAFSYSLALGKAGHELLMHANRLLCSGAPVPGSDSLVQRFFNASHFAHREQAAEAVHAVRTMVENYRTYLTDNNLLVLSFERFIKTPPMSVTTEIRVVLSGKIDVLLLREDGVVLSLDFKTSNALPAPEILAQRISSTVYRCLAKQVCPEVSQILVGQMLVNSGVTTIVALDDAVVDTNKSRIRELVIALDQDEEMVSPLFNPSIGEHCAWCRYQEVCPLLGTDDSNYEVAF